MSMENEVLAGYQYVDSKVGHADASVHGAPMWHGWALREAFVAGIEWERKRTGNPPQRPRCSTCGGNGTVLVHAENTAGVSTCPLVSRRRGGTQVMGLP